MNFADLLELPDSRRLVVCEHYPSIELEYLDWTITASTMEIDYIECLVDGGLEAWTSATNLTNWDEYAVGTSTVNQEGADFHGGTYACRFDVDVGDDHVAIYQDFNIPASSPCMFSFWYKTTGAATLFWNIYTVGHSPTLNLQADGTWAEGGGSKTVSSADWALFSLAFDSHDDCTTYEIELRRGSAASESIYIDDVSILREEEVPVPCLYTYYTPMTAGEIIEVFEDGDPYAEVFSTADCEATTSTFFMDLATKCLYLHTSNGDIPSHQTTGTYDFCILAYFIIGFCDRMDESGKDPEFEPEIEKLLDGGFEDWESATALTHWTKSESSGSSISREETEVYGGAYSAKFLVDAGDKWFERMEYATDAEAQAAYEVETPTTGGTITIEGSYRVHTFYESGNFVVTGGPITVEVLVVAGGGGTHNIAGSQIGSGGGGGGGVKHDAAYSANGSIAVTVGEGGTPGEDGEDSIFGTMTAHGGGAGGTIYDSGNPGGSGGGGSTNEEEAGGVGTVGEGHDGGDSMVDGDAYNWRAGGGGGGADEDGEQGTVDQVGGKGGDGIEYMGQYWGGGGGGGGNDGGGVGGLGGGAHGMGANGTPNSGTPYTGGGGGGAHGHGSGAYGGKGIVIVKVPITAPPVLAYSEATIKTEGTYALKGIALITTSLNKTLTRTLSPTLDFTGINTIKFDIRGSRTGSNIKIGIHDTGGTTTETTPNILVVDTWQTVTWDISGVSAANKDAIDKIIITVVNATAANTFYLDNFYMPSATTGLLSLYQDGVILRPGCKARVRFRLKSSVVAGIAVKWRLQDAGGNVWYNATTETWGAVVDNEVTDVTSAGWTEVVVPFTADDGYSEYELIVKTGTTDLGEVYSFYLDNASLVRILEPMPYRAIIPQGGAPQITQSVGDYYIGDVAFSAGELKYGNDGWWYEAFEDYIWHLKEFWLKAGAIDSEYSELGILFWGRTSRPVVTDKEATFEIVDAREGLFGSLPATFYDLTTYPNMNPDEAGKAIPILFGELDNITPICIDTTIFKYKIAGHVLEAISAVYKDGVTLTITTDYTVNLALGEFTLVADPLTSVITCKAKGAKCKIQDGTYSNVGADILYAVLTTFNSPPLPKSMIDLESFLDLQATRTQPLAAYLTGGSVLDFIRKLQDSNVFHLIPLANGSFGAFRYASGITGEETRIDQLDMASFELSYDTAPVRKSVIVKYGQDPTTQNWLAEQVTDAKIGYRYDQAEILEKETLLTTGSDAALLAQFFLNIVRSPEKRVVSSVPALLLGHRPAEKIVVSKSIRDGEGVTQTVLSEEVYRALTLVKNAGPATVEVEAVLDIQSTGAMHNNVSHVDTHSDSHTDSPHEDEHGDSEYSDHSDDIPHGDNYDDTPYADVKHVDTHGDSHSNIAHWDIHSDSHADQHGNIHNDYHTDDPYLDYVDGVHEDEPHGDHHGDVHWDSHTDTHANASHSDGAHTDQHTDTHQDSHTDTPHVDKHYDRAHRDTSHQDGGHDDTAHTDVTHEDVAHEDEHGNIAHGDSEY